NHDNAVLGALPEDLVFDLTEHYIGTHKIIGRDERESRRMAKLLQDPQHARTADPVDLSTGIVREVTADERRAPFTVAQFVESHTDPSNTGPGPVGHGFDPDRTEPDSAYYTFPIAPGVTGISLDTTNTAGFADGSV